jgi:adenylate cyclase
MRTSTKDTALWDDRAVPTSESPDSPTRALTALLRELGLPESAIGRAVEREHPEAPALDTLLAHQREERTASAADIEAAGGLPVEETLAIFAAFGLRQPSSTQAAFTDQEVDAFTRLAQLRGIWPQELTIQLARVYGRHLSRMAQSALQLFRLYVEPDLRAKSESGAAELQAVQFALAELLPLAEPFLAGVYRRWVDHELAQQAVYSAEVRSGSPLPGAVTVALLFCDLKDFTAYADVNGDGPALVLIDRFTDLVVQERGDAFRLCKLLGDGVMLAYAEAAEAVAVGSQIVRKMRSEESPGVHASLHYGTAIVREGDYFGGAVNLAARLLTVAGKGELVASRQAAEACGDLFAWQSLGRRRFRGLAEPIDVLRLAL